MQYSADGARLFSCGVATGGGSSTLVEWNESDGAIARWYAGFRNPTQQLARFDTIGNRYLVVGDESLIKVMLADQQTARMSSSTWNGSRALVDIPASAVRCITLRVWPQFGRFSSPLCNVPQASQKRFSL